MKNFKRFLAAICSMVMMFTVLCVNVGAVDAYNIDPLATGSITITKYDTGAQNKVAGVVFKAEMVAEMVQYSYTSGTTVLTDLMFKLTSFGESVFIDTGYLDYSDAVDAGSGVYYFTATQLQTALDNLINDGTVDLTTYTYTTPGSGTTDTSGVIEWTGLDLGVYLVIEDVDSSDPYIGNESVTITKGSSPFLVSLPQTSDGTKWEYDVNVEPKNIIGNGESKKTVSGSNIVTGLYNGESTSTVTIGNEYTYTITNTIVKTTDSTAYEEYRIVDTTEAGISYVIDTDNLASFFTTAALGDTDLIYDTDYRFVYNYNTTTGISTFTLYFTNAGLAILNSVTADTTLTFAYTAKLNSSAEIGSANTNTATVTYEHGSTSTTETVTSDVYTYGINLYKEFTSSGADATKVQFTLADSNGDPIYATYSGGIYTVDTSIDSADIDNSTYYDTYICGAAGIIYIRGLANGTYTVTEIQTDEGYSLLSESVSITVDNAIASATIVNETKPIFTLPLTGGNGSWLYTAIGVGLMGAAVLMVAKLGRKKKTA